MWRIFVSTTARSGCIFFTYSILFIMLNLWSEIQKALSSHEDFKNSPMMLGLAIKKYSYLSSSLLADGKSIGSDADFLSAEKVCNKVFCLQTEKAVETHTEFEDCVFFLCHFGADARAFRHKKTAQFKNCTFLHCGFRDIIGESVFQKCGFTTFKNSAVPSFPEKVLQKNCLTTKV
jgi:hypothetical protein